MCRKVALECIWKISWESASDVEVILEKFDMDFDILCGESKVEIFGDFQGHRKFLEICTKGSERLLFYTKDLMIRFTTSGWTQER